MRDLQLKVITGKIVAVAWQIAHEYESPTQVALRDCLLAIGVEPGRDVDTVWTQVQENKIDPVECTLGPEAAANK